MSVGEVRLQFLGDPVIAPRGLLRLFPTNLERTRDPGESVRVGVCVSPRPHVPPEWGWGWGRKDGGLTDIREQLPDSLARPGLS